MNYSRIIVEKLAKANFAIYNYSEVDTDSISIEFRENRIDERKVMDILSNLSFVDRDKSVINDKILNHNPNDVRKTLVVLFKNNRDNCLSRLKSKMLSSISHSLASHYVFLFALCFLMIRILFKLSDIFL